jgi:hypothetical protein
MSGEFNSYDPGRATPLVYCGVVAGPLFTVVAVVEMLTRSGFDLRRHDLSLLSNGSLGWIQISNFVLAGVLTVAAALGMRWVLRSGRGRTWAPILIAIYGIGYIGAGVFVADPMNGFPLGTLNGLPGGASWHSWMHLLSGSVGFIALIAACFTFARRFSGQGQRGWRAYSMVTGIVVLAAVIGISSGSQAAATIIGFFVAATIGWAWLSALSLRLLAEAGTSTSHG